MDTSQCDAVAQRGDGIVCYKQVSQILQSYNQSLATCSQNGMHLLSVMSQQENDVIFNLIDQKLKCIDTWLGAYESIHDWQWLDGK